MKISQIATLKVGVNPVYKSEVTNWYSLKDLEDDLLMNYGQVNYETSIKHSNPNLTFKGELVFGMVKNKIALVSSQHTNKMLGINFIKVTLDLTQVDPWYFMYYVNESDQFKHQLFINITNSNVKRITGKQLAACQINLPVLSKQVIIGKLYQLKLKHDLLINEENKLIKQLLCCLNNKGDIYYDEF